MEINSNKVVAQQMVERQIGNIYENLRGQALELVGKNPAFKTIANNYIRVNEQKWLLKLQEYCDMIIETSFIDPNTTLEQGLANADALVNAYIGNFLEEKLNVPVNSVNIALQLLLGTQI